MKALSLFDVILFFIFIALIRLTPQRAAEGSLSLQGWFTVDSFTLSQLLAIASDGPGPLSLSLWCIIQIKRRQYRA